MIILPAIDIKDGQCVRLYKGDYATAQRVAEDAAQTAETFRAAGAAWLHTVDLDGAKDAHPVNDRMILSLAATSGLAVEVGGGIRDIATIERYLSGGVSRVILGSAALKNPTLCREAAQKYGARIAVGIDAKGGRVAAEGWLETSDTGYLELAKSMEQAGVQTIIYTDIGRDGTLSGPNLEELDAINRAVSCDIIASGGVTDAGDIRALRDLGLYGAVCGKSLYQGTLDLREAIEIAGCQHGA